MSKEMKEWNVLGVAHPQNLAEMFKKMAEGKSKHAWEIIASHEDECSTNSATGITGGEDCEIDALLDSAAEVDYSDLVGGWSAMLSDYQSQPMLEDQDSQPCNTKTIAKTPPTREVQIMEELGQEEAKSDSPSNEQDKAKLQRMWVKDSDLENFNMDSREPSAQNGDDRLIRFNNGNFTDTPQFASAITDAAESVTLTDSLCRDSGLEVSKTESEDDETYVSSDTMHEQAQAWDVRERDDSLETVPPHMYSSLNYELSMLNANLAHCQLEKMALEDEISKEKTSEYQVVECEDGERWVLNPAQETICQQYNDSDQSLEDQILDFVEKTRQVIRCRIETWSLDVNRENEREDNSSISNIPYEMLLQIMSYIPIRTLMTVVSCVCKRWYITASDASLWRHLYIPADSSIDPHWLCYVASRCPQLHTLSLRGGHNINSHTLSVITRYCPSIRSLDLGFCDTTLPMLDDLVSRCRFLKSVNFEGCECVNQLWIEKLCTLQSLSSVNLSHSVTLLDDDVIYLSENLSNLVNVNIDGNSLLSDRCVVPLCVGHSQTLKTLSIDGAESTDLSISHISNCASLHLLTISFAENLTHLSVDYLLKLQNLRQLQIRKNNILDSTCLCRLFQSQSLQHLHYLDLTECTQTDDKVIEVICQRCPKLVRLILGWCWNISDIGVELIVNHCSKLEYLDLLGLDQIEGDSFVNLPEKLPNLTLLILVQCNRIKDNLIKEMLQRMPQLTAINFYHEDFRTETMTNY